MRKGSKRLTRATVLVVDDDEDIRGALAEMLAEAGYAIASAADGKEALDLLFSSRVTPDLIILDLKMPRRSGYEVLEALRASVSLVKIPVIVLSAHLASLPRGAVAWLKKPAPPVALMGTVERFLAPSWPG